MQIAVFPSPIQPIFAGRANLHVAKMLHTGKPRHKALFTKNQAATHNRKWLCCCIAGNAIYYGYYFKHRYSN